MIAPAAWAVELTSSGQRLAEHRFGFVVPIVTSAVFLLLLVVRLGLIARVAQRRAGELAGRSAALSRAVSEQEELQQQLAYRAIHDPLTGLSNRAVLAERLDELLDQPDRHGRHALLLFDLDGFKDVNDTLGHPTGDELLVGWPSGCADGAPAERHAGPPRRRRVRRAAGGHRRRGGAPARARTLLAALSRTLRRSAAGSCSSPPASAC